MRQCTKRVYRLPHVPVATAAIFYILRSNKLCDIMILIKSRHYYIQKYDVYVTSHENEPEHISSIIMTLNNSNKLNDNEMLICQRLKLAICDRFFVPLRLSFRQRLLFYMWCLGHKIRCNCNLYSINNEYIHAFSRDPRKNSMDSARCHHVSQFEINTMLHCA